MNDFEKYLLEHKQQLEPDQVNSSVWLKIENAVLRDKNYKYKKYALIGLLLLLGLFAIGAVFYLSQKQEPLNEEKILAELNLSQYNFTKQVNMKKEALAAASVPQSKIDNFQILLQQLEFMDGQFQDYKLYIEQNGYQDFIGEQILNFYKSKILLLDKIQEEIKKINYYESKQPSHSKKVSIQI